MPLIDAKYEIISQLIDGDRETYFLASAPDGSTVRIAWYKLSTLEDEQQFEQFRKLLRILGREKLAAVYDIVSRPGAHYVVWKDGQKLNKAKSHKSIDSILQDYGYKSEMADIRSIDSKTQVFDLKFSRESIVISKDLIEFKPKKIKKPWATRILAFAASIMFLSAIGFLILSFGQLTSSSEVKLENLIGYNINDAAEYLYSKHLKMSSSPSPSDHPVGEVLDMDPQAGKIIRPFYRTVHLVYSSPIGELNSQKVVNLVGKKYSSNTADYLEANSFNLGKVFYLKSDKAAKTILGQSKAAGNSAPKGASIDIIVSSNNPKQSFLPNLKGMTIEDARFFIGLSGLRVEELYEKSSLEKNSVIGQSVKAFTAIDLDDSSIKLYISSGLDGHTKPTVNNNPNLIALSLPEAQSIAGTFSLDVEEISSAKLPNVIISQQPAPNQANPNRRIRVVLNNYVPPLVIPQPNIETHVFNNQARKLDFSWAVEPNLSLSAYQVHAITSDGQTHLAQEGFIKGGEIVSGTWQTQKPGPVRFRLYLNGFQYSIEILRN